MTGLEKILKTIEANAKAAAEVVLNQAKQEAQQIMDAARVEAEKRVAEIQSKSETDVNAVLSRAVSGAALQEKKIILDAKQQIINEIIAKARKTLMELSDEDYVKVLLQMVRKFAQKKAGIIQFSEADLKRLPSDFEISMKNVLAEKQGAQLQISEIGANIDGGFVLHYNEIEENCSFDALFLSYKDDLQDEINSLLFLGASDKEASNG